MTLNDIGQLPDSHPIWSGEGNGVSFAHIDVRGDLRRQRENFTKAQAKSAAANKAACAGFSVGQAVRSVRRQGADFLNGAIVEIVDGALHIEIDGAIRVYRPTFFQAA